MPQGFFMLEPLTVVFRPQMHANKRKFIGIDVTAKS